MAPRVAIFWDFETCRPPEDYGEIDALESICSVAGRHGMIERFNLYYERSVVRDTAFLAFQDHPVAFKFNLVECDIGQSHVDLVTRLTTDMFLSTLDSPAIATIVLMSGTSALGYPLSVLRKKGYSTVLGSPFADTAIFDSDVVLDWQLEVLNFKHKPPKEQNRDGQLFAKHERVYPTRGQNTAALHQKTQRKTTSARHHENNLNQKHDSEPPPDPGAKIEKEDEVKKRPNRLPPLTDQTRDPNTSDRRKSPGHPQVVYPSAAIHCRQRGDNTIGGLSVQITPSTSKIQISSPSSTRQLTHMALPPLSESDPGYSLSIPRDPKESSPPQFRYRHHSDTRPPTSSDATQDTKVQASEIPGAGIFTGNCSPGQDNNDTSAPPSFAPLIETLMFLQEKGEERPLRSLFGKVFFSRATLPADINDLGHYTKLAKLAGIVELGGKGGASWISLVSGVESHP